MVDTFSRSRGRRSFMGFLGRSRRNSKRSESIDITVIDGSSDIGEECESSSRSRQLQEKHASLTLEKGAFSRAVTYLKRRSPHSIVLPASPVDEQISNSQSGRVQDIFCTELNNCDPSSLPDLRRQRLEEAPIICHETDDDEEENKQAAEDDVALKSRLEALEVQQRLLGKDHPDVNFMVQHIGRLQSRRRSDSIASRVHYYFNPYNSSALHNLPSN